MNDDRNIKVLIEPDVESLREFEERLGDVAVNVNLKSAAGVTPGYEPDNAQRVQEAADRAIEAQIRHQEAADAARVSESLGKIIDEAKKGEKKGTEDEKSDRKRSEAAARAVQMGVSAGTQAMRTLLTSSMEFIEGIYERLKASSPLLQAIESMFNLAVQLFFMPLGNKLAEMLIPATMDLLDTVVEMWDAFDGMTFPEMLDYAIVEGSKLFGEYLSNIGSVLAEGNGLSKSIGEILLWLGDFVENDMANVLTSIFGVISFILDNLKTFISLFVGLMGAQIGATIGASMWWTFGAGAIGGAAIGGYAGYGFTDAILTQMGMADGGYVPATEGGQLRVLGEGGEGEYVIPESKVGAMGGSTTINYYINGYTDNELRSIIRETVDEQISRARIRGSF